MHIGHLLLKALSIKNLASEIVLENTTPGIPKVQTSLKYSPQYAKVDLLLENEQEIDRINGRRPLVIWHGLGDNYNSSGMVDVVSIFNQRYPDMFIYPIFLDAKPSKDQEKTLFGDANKEVEYVCEQLSAIHELKEGFDAIGFSQGGLFMRALVQRCSSVSVHNLITFGSPHMGVLELPMCKPNDWLCKRKNAILKRQVWHENIQKSIIPAQYFRDPYEYDNYVSHSNFLADVNNELAQKSNPAYAKNLNKLSKFVMVVFTKDTTLVPKESAGFNDWDTIYDKTIPFDKTSLYENDLLGLRTMNENGKLAFLEIEEDHMVISDTFLVDIAENYVGGSL